VITSSLTVPEVDFILVETKINRRNQVQKFSKTFIWSSHIFAQKSGLKNDEDLFIFRRTHYIFGQKIGKSDRFLTKKPI